MATADTIHGWFVASVDLKSGTPVTIIPATTGKKFIPLSCHVICTAVSGSGTTPTGQVLGNMNSDAAAIVAGGGASLPVFVGARAILTIQSASAAFWSVDLNSTAISFDVETVSTYTTHTARVVLEGILY